ncbi:ecto-ADP-ribosyltransferase 5-like [Perca fluviatilis]|uniref:ecto-ADP-ribosyltransferase 5-like n=1 Tax=Perca fluviatilis TaxID=8168 RepID=UPI001964C1B2|nr:ecto-ADP-ribosyltransferase 5-like [Perca fluviatilis]
MAMMVVLAAVVFTYGVSPGIARDDGESGAVAGAGTMGDSVLPLDMAENSVDDMYDGCKKEMKKRVTKDLEIEKEADKVFKKIWETSEKNKHIFKWIPKVLTQKQIVAISSYTYVGIKTENGLKNVYGNLNTAVRTQGPEYNTAFGYHALHFLLTTAIQAKRVKQCLTVYRRVNVSFSQDVQNKSFRFGSFTSASLNDYLNAAIFGDKSCFEIVTCMGAKISSYSSVPKEREVLIPPYEVFKVVDITRPTTKLPCEVVYKVKSTGYVSKLNCALFPK